MYSKKRYGLVFAIMEVMLSYIVTEQDCVPTTK